MGLLVIDEWFWSDLSGENGSENQSQTFKFMKAVFKKCDCLVMVEGSNFAQKAYALMKATDITRREIARYFSLNFLYNPQKVHRIHSSMLQPLTEEIATAVNLDDHYLIQACQIVEGSSLVTTDGPLLELANRFQINCAHKSDFVPQYVESHGA